MRAILSLLLVAVMTVGLVGCASSERKTELDAMRMARMQNYKRIAIVCAPRAGADASYAEMILDEVRRMAPSRLGFLDTVDCLSGVAVDIAADPPTADLGAGAADYDGVICLLYEYGAGHVILDMYLVDIKTGEQAWHHRLDSRDENVRYRLGKHGFWTPTTIKRECYGAR